jgi:hypothetical protein
MSSDRRKIVRRPVRYPARIDLGGAAELLPCMLVDASDEGVQVVTREPVEWPNEIDLVLGYDDRNGRRRCRVAWRNGKHAGLEFLAKNTRLVLPAHPSQRAAQTQTEQPAKPAPPLQPSQAAPREPEPQGATQRSPFDIDTLPSS